MHLRFYMKKGSYENAENFWVNIWSIADKNHFYFRSIVDDIPTEYWISGLRIVPKSINIDSFSCVQPGAEKQFLCFNPLVFVGKDRIKLQRNRQIDLL